MYQYLFAPVFVGVGPKGQPEYEPGYLVDGELVSAVHLLPPRTAAPVCDRDRVPMRFVIKAPQNWGAPDDWIPTTLTECATVYPGRV